MKRILSALAVAGALVASRAEAAGSTNTTFQVTANIASKCTINATNLGFGAYEPVSVNVTGTPLDGTSTVSVRCTGGTAPTIGLDNGVTPTAGQRQMVSGAVPLQYELYSDSARTKRWGQTAGTDLVAPAAYPKTQNVDYTVYGRIPGGQDTAIVGSYQDTITATVNF